jgi:hypothetical protein
LPTECESKRLRASIRSPTARLLEKEGRFSPTHLLFAESALQIVGAKRPVNAKGHVQSGGFRDSWRKIAVALTDPVLTIALVVFFFVVAVVSSDLFSDLLHGCANDPAGS